MRTNLEKPKPPLSGGMVTPSYNMVDEYDLL
jgi:hypothetical protein